MNLKSSKKRSICLIEVCDLKKNKKLYFYQIITKIFLQTEKDGDGTISCDEMKHVMKLLGHKFSDEALENIMNLIDANSNLKKKLFKIKIITNYHFIL